MYEIYDTYEECEMIATVDTYAEASAIAQERFNDTDGECSIMVYDTRRSMPVGWDPI